MYYFYSLTLSYLNPLQSDFYPHCPMEITLAKVTNECHINESKDALPFLKRNGTTLIRMGLEGYSLLETPSLPNSGSLHFLGLPFASQTTPAPSPFLHLPPLDGVYMLCHLRAQRFILFK